MRDFFKGTYNWFYLANAAGTMQDLNEIKASGRIYPSAFDAMETTIDRSIDKFFKHADLNYLP